MSLHIGGEQKDDLMTEKNMTKIVYPGFCVVEWLPFDRVRAAGIIAWKCFFK